MIYSHPGKYRKYIPRGLFEVRIRIYIPFFSSALQLRAAFCSPKYCGSVPLRPLRYKHWTPESMHAAMRAVIEESKSVREAAQQYDVPKSTLGDRLSGRVLPGATSGQPTYLTNDEEK